MTQIQEMWCKAHLECGEYILFSKGKWEFSQENTYTVSSYGPSLVELKQVKKPFGMMNSIFLKKGLA